MINEYIFDFVFNEALRDLYWRKKDNGGLKNVVYSNCKIKQALKDYAQNVIAGKNPCLYVCASAICKADLSVKAEDREIKMNLSFGNAQKLINMTMKHLYIKYYDTKREEFRCCHAPMDSKMMALVYEAYVQVFDKKPKFCNTKSWGTMKMEEKEQYIGYQDAIIALIMNDKQDCLPIEFDYLNWGKTNVEELEYDFFKTGERNE